LLATNSAKRAIASGLFMPTFPKYFSGLSVYNT